MDPRMDSGDTVTSDHREETDDRDWYAVLWDSVADPDEQVEPPETSMKLPTEPTAEQPAE